MNNPLSQALHSLLPTTNHPPPQLLDLAASLLAQSNHKASTLKQDEEIARPYACAHLACDRLKTALDLPPIDPRPPVPPRIYRRLYNHLDHILPASVPATRTPRARTPSAKLKEREDQFSRSLGRQPQPREKTLGDFRPGGGTAGKEKREGLPPWIRPTLRFLCAQLGTKEIAPTVIAGVDGILVPHGRRTDDAWGWGHLTPLLASLYLYVWNSTQVDGVDEDRYVDARSEVVSTLTKARREVKIKETEGWEGWTDLRAEEVDEATLRISREGWLESDWARGMDELAAREEGGGGEKRGEGEGEKEGRRGDVMFQEKLDFLGERKRAAYRAWKEEILGRMEEMEGGGCYAC